MNNFLSLSRNFVGMLLILAAAALTVLAGLILLGLAAMHALAFPVGGKDLVPPMALLIAVIVLLIAIFVLLLILLWCCCRCGKADAKQLPPDVIGALLPFVPLVSEIPDALRKTALALRGSSDALGFIQTNLQAVGDLLVALCNLDATNHNSNFEVPMPPSFGFEYKGGYDGDHNEIGPWLYQITGPQPGGTVSLSGLMNTLREAGTDLQRSQLVNPATATVLVDINVIKGQLSNAANVLDSMADTISPP